MRGRPQRRSTARLLLVLMVLLPAAFTLGEAPTAETELFGRALRALLPEITPLEASDLRTSRVEFVANVLLFLPLGVALPVAAPRVPLSVLLLGGALASLAVEAAQRAYLVGRTPDVVDVVANATGVAVGLLLGADLERLLARRSARRPPRVR